jgi:hypothetical protein
VCAVKNASVQSLQYDESTESLYATIMQPQIYAPNGTHSYSVIYLDMDNCGTKFISTFAEDLQGDKYDCISISIPFLLTLEDIFSASAYDTQNEVYYNFGGYNSDLFYQVDVQTGDYVQLPTQDHGIIDIIFVE